MNFYKNPWRVLGLREGAPEEEIRRAYLSKLTEHPPDVDSEAFERVRDAYQSLADPFEAFGASLAAVDPYAPVVTAIESDSESDRKFIGPNLWLDALAEGS